MADVEIRRSPIEALVVRIEGPGLTIDVLLPSTGAGAVVFRFPVSVRELILEAVDAALLQSEVEALIFRLEALHDHADRSEVWIAPLRPLREELRSVGADGGHGDVDVALAEKI